MVMILKIHFKVNVRKRGMRDYQIKYSTCGMTCNGKLDDLRNQVLAVPRLVDSTVFKFQDPARTRGSALAVES